MPSENCVSRRVAKRARAALYTKTKMRLKYSMRTKERTTAAYTLRPTSATTSEATSHEHDVEGESEHMEDVPGMTIMPTACTLAGAKPTGRTTTPSCDERRCQRGHAVASATEVSVTW